MKIGIIYCAYNCANFLSEGISTFIKAKQNGLINNISVVSVPFIEYFNIKLEEDSTIEILKNLKIDNHIDALFIEPKFIKESDARDLCLQYLKSVNCDAVWMVDGDELYTDEDIKNIINFVTDNPKNYWYSINFKNYIFDAKQWIDGFCPPRIFKTNVGLLSIDKFYWDNDIVYKDIDNNFFNYKCLENITIPQNIANIKHMTWLHTNGRQKYEYQLAHFGHCGYKWNYEVNKLEINTDFYLKNNLQIPTINYE